MSLGTILLIILVIALLGGFSGLGGGHSSCGLEGMRKSAPIHSKSGHSRELPADPCVSKSRTLALMKIGFSMGAQRSSGGIERSQGRKAERLITYIPANFLRNGDNPFTPSDIGICCN
jgi:hypothetical protein